MEDKDNNEYSVYLIDNDQAQVEKKKSHCCLFTCCCGEGQEISKTKYINKWRKYLVTRYI